MLDRLLSVDKSLNYLFDSIRWKPKRSIFDISLAVRTPIAKSKAHLAICRVLYNRYKAKRYRETYGPK